MRLALGSDHRGLEMKGNIMDYLKAGGHTAEDLGCFSNDAADYPDYASAVAEAVATGKADYGILICSSGIGMSITANKYKGIRAALCSGPELAKRARLHNDANVLCMGSDFISTKEALQTVDNFINTGFEGGRHQHRLDKVSKLESC
ncbi:MAG: ribose 5-phosphate isomerase B [Dehalococcoidia bacterium]|nr:ribose 5-phosphate isomerase B [Dehalococcoidia bacterium]